ncbi:MAG: single-stranded DNA-binding protein [Bacteroidales bacterium]|nr:single-stranded DNA-binding protein [Bacteroidales bacterium]
MVNKVILVGNVGKDPTIRFVETRQLAEFTLATTERGYTTATGVQIPERTEWHNIVMWDRHAEFAEKYIRKGTKLFIEGRLRYRTWVDRTGLKHNITEILVEQFDLLSRAT